MHFNFYRSSHLTSSKDEVQKLFLTYERSSVHFTFIVSSLINTYGEVYLNMAVMVSLKAFLGLLLPLTIRLSFI